MARKFPVLDTARELDQAFRPVQLAEIDGSHHAFVVRYEGDFDRHVHRGDEFVYVLEGEISFEMEHAYITLGPGESILIPAGVPHKPRCRETALAMIVERVGLQAEPDDSED